MVGKRYNTGNQNFLLSLQHFLPFRKETPFLSNIYLSPASAFNPDSSDPKKEGLLKTMWKKGENAGNQHLLLFPQCFLPFHIKMKLFDRNVICYLKKISNWAKYK